MIINSYPLDLFMNKRKLRMIPYLSKTTYLFLQAFTGNLVTH